MRIVHVITRLIVGGAQENTLLSCEGQHRRGHDVTLITGPPLGPEGSLLEKARSGGYRVEILDDLRRAIMPLRDWRALRRLTARLRALQPDVAHTHSSKAGILGRWAAHRAGVPAIVHTIHGLSFTASRWRAVNGTYRMLEKLSAPITSRIVCVADAMRDISLAAGIGRPEQYVTVYSGMDTGAFLSPPVPRGVARRSLGLQEHHIVVGTIARLFHMKGHDDLLDVAPRLCAAFADLRFLWVGDGILRGQFERRMSDMNLRDRFVLTGLVPPHRIPELAGAMDIVVHPSRREGLARAIVQGQLAGCAVVAYDTDGNREGMIDGQTGFLVRPFDAAELCRRLEALLADAGLRRRMGEAGRRFAARRFSADTMVDALERVYTEALHRSDNT